MKYLLLLLIATNAHAQCFDSINFGHGAGMNIVRKLDNHHYEVVSAYPYFRAILETRKTTFDSTGPVYDLRIEYHGSRKVHLNNGFDDTMQVVRECK